MSTSSSRALAAVALVALVAATPATAGLFGGGKQKPRDPDYAPVYAPAYPTAPANGAIFQVANGYAPLTSGARASMVGDLVTIQLVESTQAVKSATQSSGRTGNIGLTPPTTGPLSFFNPSDIGMGGTNQFDGKGQATQTNQLRGEITVTVAQVHPNGTMTVRGEKMVRLNRGDENIRITGLVRAADIGPDNRVLSTRVADARIAYTGTGEVARASKQGWLQRFFSVVSPF